MTAKVDSRSLIIGAFLAITVFLVLGAVPASNKSVYQLSMTAIDGDVVFARMHTGTGRMETWRCSNTNASLIPRRGNRREFINPGKDITISRNEQPVAYK
jgi:hypothetical protein